MTTEPITFPAPGDKALAVLGPDYAPNAKIEVEIVSRASPDSWVCKDADSRLLTIRTRKLTKL